MESTSRRKFIAQAAIAGSMARSSFKSTPMITENIFVHHVYFWLKNPSSAEDLAKLKEGLLKLSKVKTIQQFHIGRAADTNRDVIERSYSLSWLVIFKNGADQASYQEDPIHLKFVDECSPLWSKVVVYDSVDA